jgi:hypothetical protein
MTRNAPSPVFGRNQRTGLEPPEFPELRAGLLGNARRDRIAGSAGLG